MNTVERESKKHFFSLVIDDGGFLRTYPDDKGDPVDFSAYENLVKIAQRFGIQIVLSCTSKFFDINKISENPQPHEDTPRIISLLERNSDYLIFADHGYEHQFNDSYSEFNNYISGIPRPVHEQEKQLDQSIAIYRSLGWPNPQLFVPPQNGWEPGVTDRLCAERGIKYLIAFLRIITSITKLFNPFNKKQKPFFKAKIVYPHNSKYLEILPRLGLGIPSYVQNIKGFMWKMAYQRVVPINLIVSSLLYRKSVTQPHNYMAHIVNFVGDNNFRNWCKFIESIGKKNVTLPASFNESLKLFHSHQVNKNV